MSAKQGWVDTGSSSNGGGAWPYTISQLISSKSADKYNRNSIYILSRSFFRLLFEQNQVISCVQNFMNNLLLKQLQLGIKWAA